MKILFALLSVALIAQVVYDERKNLKFALTIWSRFRLLMLLEVIGVFIATVGIYILLALTGKVFEYGWMHLFFSKGGNVYITPITDTAHSSVLWVQMIPFLFFPLLLLSMPFVAHIEEKMFREDCIKWRDITKRSISFGLVHCLVGVPLGAGIALIATGFFYGCKYRQSYIREVNRSWNSESAKEKALLVSTTYHTLYNSAIVILIAISMVFMIMSK